MSDLLAMWSISSDLFIQFYPYDKKETGTDESTY